jgi:hypothetical protein
MKLSQRTVMACLVGVVVLGVACWGAVAVRGAGTAPALAVSGGCPREVRPAVTFGPARMIAVLRALKAQVPRVYANLTSMGHPAWPHFQLQALVRLDQFPLSGPRGFLPPIRGISRYEALAARACGKKAALSSVLVFLQFPYCQLPCAVSWAYMTPTRTGWHLWTSYQV